jgi:hypothetical protein
MHLRVLLQLCFLLLFVHPCSLIAQAEAESSTLVLESQQSRANQTIETGTLINYRLTGGQMQRSGRLEAVSDSTMTVAGKEVKLDEVDVLVRFKGKNKRMGKNLLIASLIAWPNSFILSLIAFWVEFLTGLLSLRPIATGLFFIFLVGMPILIIVALILMLTARKRFDLRKAWSLRKG